MRNHHMFRYSTLIRIAVQLRNFSGVELWRAELLHTFLRHLAPANDSAQEPSMPFEVATSGFG